jgi:hypothetical protein
MPSPKDYDNKEDFIKACIPIVIKEGTAKDNNQAIAICNSMWDKKEMKLDTVNIGEVEIFETGVWKGQKYDEKDIDQFIDNFNKGVAEPYITIDHNPKATKEFSNALKAMALGFVDKLERKGNKLLAWFKQVPKTVADLIEAGALKKKSIEFYRNHVANGNLYKNVLQGVTFHGANGLPEVNTLSDFLSLYKSNLQTMDKPKEEIVSLQTKDKEVSKPMENEINLKKDEYTELLKKSSQIDVLQSQVESLTENFKKVKSDNEKIIEENERLKKEHEDFEKNKKESLKKEADSYISKKINDGFIKPAHKDRYVSEYITYKSDEVKFKDWQDDIESRGKVISVAPTKAGDQVIENFKYDPDSLDYKAGATINYEELNNNIEAYKKANNCTWEEAAVACGVMHPEEIKRPGEEVTA